MNTRNHARLTAELAEEYARRSPTSAALQQRAEQVMVDGGNHNVRLLRPFPPRIVRAKGAWITDEDGHRILDFWQGHLANILGHNPPVVTSVLAEALAGDFGLQSGLTDRLQIEVAELLCRQTGAERVRLTTSGTLATMYAIMLARAFTGRDLVAKVGGGWHGAQPWALKGVGFEPEPGGCFEHLDSQGLAGAINGQVLVTRFNDPDHLSQVFGQCGDRVACFIVEPFVGAGGILPATAEYLRTARELTQRHGALLILDEVIAGFRFRAGDVGALYGVRPDLATFGKVAGGGMPVAAVAGRADVMNLVGRAAGIAVRFSGGTYSAHPASMLAAKTMLSYLVEHEAEVYPRLADIGERFRRALEGAFLAEGILARCTGAGGGLPGSSLGMLHFPYRPDLVLDKPDVCLNPSLCDVELCRVVELALLLEDVHLIQGHGAVSITHTEADIDFLSEACRRVARRIRNSREA